MRAWLKSFHASERGVTAIEYAIIAGAITVAIVATVGGIGNSLMNIFTTIAGYF
jgi:pilus assembly protein Flp/PilA